MTPTQQHKLWIRKQAERYPTGRPGTELPPCDNCRCLGNCECGHEPLDSKNLCTLDHGFCPCCTIEDEAMTDKEYDAITGQRRLL